ncbi:MAG: helix-turn-helix transcriptional regulator [Gammaproteobacteria bacterium]
MDAIPHELFLRRPDVLKRIGVSRQTLYRLLNSGEFDPPVAITRGCLGWPSSYVDAWIRSRCDSKGRGK